MIRNKIVSHPACLTSAAELVRVMTDENLLPRDDLLDLIHAALRRGSVLLHGPRRVGKSTTIEQLAAHRGRGIRVVRVDLEGHLLRPVDSLVVQVHRKLVEAGLVSGDSALDRVESAQAGPLGLTLRANAQPEPWQALEDDLRAAVENLPHDLLVIALDEVPWWLDAVERQGPGQARAALAALRRIRQERTIRDHVRFILTGSIGLAGLAADLGATAELNDIETLAVPPMEPELAATLFETELAGDGRSCDRDAATEAARLSGGSPHWVKRLASLVARPGARTPVDVEAAAERLLAPSLRRELSDEGREHFQRRHPDVWPAMAAILEAVSGGDTDQPWQGAVAAALAARPGSSTRQAEDAIYLLIDGFYLRRQANGTLAWVNPLLRRWWLRYGGT